jgi:predicted transcriptional regulator
MTRDELILRALLRGARSTLELVAATGLSERACRYRLRHLIDTNYVWSPERGRYRLTGRGRVIAAEIIPDPEAPVDVSGVPTE